MISEWIFIASGLGNDSEDKILSWESMVNMFSDWYTCKFAFVIVETTFIHFQLCYSWPTH